MNKLFAAAAVSLLVILAGCEQQADRAEKGPAETLGAKIDEAALKLRPALNQAGEKIGEVLQKGGEKLEEASRNAKKEEQ